MLLHIPIDFCAPSAGKFFDANIGGFLLSSSRSVYRHVPVAYSVLNMVAYCGCIFVIAICFGALIRFNSIDRSLPARPQDYGAFILESRAVGGASLSVRKRPLARFAASRA